VRVIESIGVLLRVLFESIGVALRPMVELVGAIGAPGSGTFAFAAATTTVAVVATLALLAVAIAVFLSPARPVTTAPHPRRAISDATRLTASHPDAPGHSRPRAPGSAALAA
jgi:hypothetical protein